MNGPDPTGHPHHDTLDAYATDTLEIFTVDLEPVAAFADLADTVWVTGAALCDSLVVGQRYLWSVQAEVGGEVAARSSAQWFRMKK